MEDYKSNSHKSKAELATTDDKKVDKVVNGKVTTKKKSKIAESFVSEDIHNVKDYVIMDVLIPAAKKAISDVVTNGIDMILYGEAGRSNKRSSNTPYISYNRFSDNRGGYREKERTRTRTAGYSHDDIILETRSEAEEVLDRMDELIQTYGMVSVADLYDLIGLSCEYTDNKYGWTNLRSADAVRVRDGYLLKLPRAILLD